jgi:SsrA-binding protein
VAPKTDPRYRIASENRRARHDYFIDEVLEAGMVLYGSEVKSLRKGHGNLTDSYAGPMKGELFLLNAYIPEFASASHFGHGETRRPRKLLLHKRQVERLFGLIKRAGVTLVPLKIYFNERGIAKVELGLARGKRKVDKRNTEKERDWERDKSRLMREKG